MTGGRRYESVYAEHIQLSRVSPPGLYMAEVDGVVRYL